MRGEIKIGILFLIIAIFATTFAILGSAIVLPDKYSGTLTINGAPAPVGTGVKGMIDGVDKSDPVGYETIQAGQYDFFVNGEDSGVDIIQFQVECPDQTFVDADQTNIFEGGGVINLDLTATCEGACVPDTEVCDGVDNDCDTLIDEGFDSGDACSVGVGACQSDGVKVCTVDGSGTVCDAVAGTPSAETCNGIDDDCDGQMDEGDVCQLPCIDNDGDGYGDNCVLGSDCNDNDNSINPGAVEICDNVDNDCDTVTDEGFDVGDVCSVGIGACQSDGVKICTQDGSGTECNAVAGSPTPEICNLIDDDCDGQTDEGGVCEEEFCIVITNMDILDSQFNEVTQVQPGALYNVRVSNLNTCEDSITSMQIVQIMRSSTPINLGTVTSTINPDTTSVITVGFVLPSDATNGEEFTAQAFNWNHWIDQDPGTFEILSASQSADFEAT